MTPEASPQLQLYRFDAAASTFIVQAYSQGLFSVFGHDPKIGVKDFTGEAQFTSDKLDNASLSLTIRADSLVVVNDIKEKDRADIERTMREEVLETRRYPEIEFKSNNVSLTQSGANRYRARVIGDLTLHGVTQKNLWLNGELTVTPDGLRAKGEVSIKQTDYKIKLVSVAGGTLKIKNEVKCSFDILARRVAEV